MQKKITIIGGGAAGFFAGINGAFMKTSYKWLLLEGSKVPLYKVKISGGGRCNLTHECFDPIKFSENYPRGSKELKGPLSQFQAKDTVMWFAKRQIKVIGEKDGRMFPESNKSSTIINCLLSEQKKSKLELKLNTKVESIRKNKNKFEITTLDQEKILTDYVILCTGSSRIGYNLATKLGHKIIAPAPSLFTFKIKDPLLDNMMGQSFTTSRLTLTIGEKTSKRKWVSEGALMITHWGLSGPATLRLSAFAARELMEAKYHANLTINWLNFKKKSHLIKILKQHKINYFNKSIKYQNISSLSKHFWEHVLLNAKIDEKSKWHHLSSKEIEQLSDILYESKMKVTGKGVFKDEFVTAGGVSCKEVNFKTMESKVCPGLFFAGEILNIDGITGGFNFQNAWTTGWIAAKALSNL